MLKKLLSKIFGRNKLIIEFKWYKVKYGVLFTNEHVADQIEAYLKNHIIAKINEKQYDDSHVIDKLLWDFRHKKEAYLEQLKEINKMKNPADQIEARSKLG